MAARGHSWVDEGAGSKSTSGDRDHVYFIGFMGAGKSTVARRLGRMLKRTHIDTDRRIEDIAKARIDQIFAREGEEGFRDREVALLTDIARMRSVLVSCGDGIVEREESRGIIARTGFAVYLDIDVDDTFSNVSNYRARPLLKDRESALELLETRRPLYESMADLTIDARGGDFSRVTRAVADALWKEGLL